MAVNVSKSGGIYIEISGDYTQLQKDLNVVRDLSKTMGADISKALDGAIAPNRAASSFSGLTQSLMKVQAASKAAQADFASQADKIREWGKAVGVSGKELENYVALQAKALKNQSQKEFEAGLRNIQRLTGESNETMNALAKTLGGTGTEFNKASRSTRELCLNMTTLYLEAAKVAALKAVWDGFKMSFDLAARYETLGVVVQQVGKVAGYSAVEVDKNVSALRSMGIAGIEARKTMTQLLQAQVDITKTPALARIAQDAAVIGGINSSESFERMVHGIQSAQVEVLRTIGLNVNFENSYAKLAAQLGKNTAELTEQEKVQARVNAVTEAGARITGTYESAMSTLGKQMSSLSRIQQDFLTDFGKFSLELAKASGGVTGYTRVLEGWSAATLAVRGKLAGLNIDEVRSAAQSGGAQGMRDLVEGTEAAREELATLKAQAQSLSQKGIDVSVFSAQLKSLEDGFFGVREKIKLLEDVIAAYESEGLDTSQQQAELEALRQKTHDAVGSVQILRKEFSIIGGLFKNLYIAPKNSADYFTVGGQTKEIHAESARIEAAYAKTAEKTKQAKIAAIAEQRATVKALLDAGKYTADEAAKMDNAFAQELETLTKSSRTASLATERTSYQAAEAARAAADSLKNTQLRHSELVAQLDGNSLGAALARSLRDYETQLDAIAKKEAEIAKNRALWAKEGKLSEEASASLDEQQISLALEEMFLQKIKEVNDEIARRADLARTYRANMDYSGLTGDLRAYYAEEVKSLDLQMETASEAEKRAIAERKRIAEARANLDVPGMLQTGMNGMSRDAQQRVIDFWEKTIPESIGAATDTIGTLFADIGTGTKSASEAFSDMGKTLQSVAHTIISDLINMSIRMTLFGQTAQSVMGASGGGGGLLGGMFGNLFNSGASRTIAGGSITVTPLPSAKGNVFSVPALSAYSNSIVSAPTLFPFAKGIGLMGEAGAEAIMPLKRMPTGDLGVRAEISGRGGGSSRAPQVSVHIHNSTGEPVAEQARTDNHGNMSLDVMIGNAAAGQMAKPGTAMNRAIKTVGGLKTPTIRR